MTTKTEKVYQIEVTRDELRMLCEAWALFGIGLVYGPDRSLSYLPHALEVGDKYHEAVESLSEKLSPLVDDAGINSNNG